MLFERFYRVDSSRSRAEGGTGLGLAIVRSIMSLHRGTVAVESSASGPTLFLLRFPLPRA
jgi:two-component system heavy metal sensor histidine kinase CusS